MPAVVEDQDQVQSTATDDLHLTSVQVAFNRGRPKGRLKLVVTLNNEDYTIKTEGNAELRWSGSIHCLLPSTARVCIYHRRRLRWEEFASIEVSLSLDFLLASNTLPIFQNYATVIITDLERLTAVTFTISESSAFLRIKRTREREEKVAADEAAREEAERAAREEAEKAAREQVEKKKFILNKLGEVRSVLDILESVHFSAGAAISALDSLAQACERQDSHFEEVIEFIDLLDPFLSVRARVKYLAQNAEARHATETMINLIAEYFRHISSPTSSSLLGSSSLSLEVSHSDPINNGNAPGHKDDRRLSELREGSSRAKAAFDYSIELEFLRKKLLKDQDVHLQFGAKDVCLDGTRVNLLERIMSWIERDNADTQSDVFWLHGRAGAGKTTVANTFARVAQDRGYLVSLFLCRRDSGRLCNARYLFPTLAYRFSQEYESYRASLFKLLCADTGYADVVATAGLYLQLCRLFRQPLRETVDPQRPHIVIIDALDECGLPVEQANLVQCMLALSRFTPWIKVILTSRDDYSIHNVFAGSACVQYNVDEERDVDRDIGRYIRFQADDLNLQLSDEDIEQLVERAGGLFIWCSTLLKHLSQCDIPEGGLQSLLSGKKQNDPRSELYRLYDVIVESAADTQHDASLIRAILSTVDVVANNRPLSAKAITTFLRLHELHACDDEQIYSTVHQLRAVLYVGESIDAVIRAHHSSFYDYLRRKSTNAVSGWERYEDVHSRMFRGCMRILEAQLHFNMCKIEIPVLNDDIHDLGQRIAEKISEELQYSSLFWFIHLSSSTLTKADAAPGVSTLLSSKRLLFWLESLSLQGSLSQSLPALQVCMRFFHGFSDAVAAANDARRAVNHFFEAMGSVPHIYLSSLFWLPYNSRTSRDLELARLKPLQLIENRQDGWDAVVWKQSEGRELYSVVFSPDGQYVASGADSGNVRIWNTRNGARKEEISAGRDTPILSLAYSPDGSLIASGSSDNTVRVWDVESKKEIFGPLTGHAGSVNCVIFSPNGQFIASSSHDRTVRVWNARTGVSEGKPLRGHRSWVLDLACSPDGLHLASGGYDCDIRVWSTATYQETMRISRSHQQGVQSVAFSPNGHTIISGSRDYTIRRWNARTGEAVGEPLRGHTGSVWSVMYFPDGFSILSSSEDRTIRIWDAETGALVGVPLCGHQGWVRSLSCSPDGFSIASASDDTTIRVWDVHTDSRTPDQVRRGHDQGVLTVAWSPDVRRIATGLKDGSICVWDAETGDAIGEPLRGHKRAVNSVFFTPDGLFIASGSDDRTVCIWDTQTSKAIGEPLRGHSDCVSSVACSADGRRIASASFDHTVRLWDAQTRSPIGEPLRVGSWVYSVAFSPDGCSLACSANDKTIQIWDISSNASLKMTLRGHSEPVWSVAFSPDGESIASASYDKSVHLWDVQTGEPQTTLIGHMHWVFCVAFSPDGRLVASCSRDHSVRLWDARTGQAVGDALRGHSDWVWSVAFSPDGRSLATAGEDRKTYVYNVPSADPSLAELEARWSTYCSRMDEEDGWIKDGDTLLLWVPPLYRPVLRVGARVMIDGDGAVASRVDVETLFRYSGENWVTILLDT